MSRGPLNVVVAAALALTDLALTGGTTYAFGADGRHGSIHISYEAPGDSAQQTAYELIKRRGTLEMLQKIFSPFQLSEDVSIKTVGCKGIPNTYFSRINGRPTIRICYEYLQHLYEHAPRQPTAQGITPNEVFVGQLLFATAHEFGHALFDIYDVPILGRREDAADQFATYFLLQFGSQRAWQLIWGAAYRYHEFIATLRDDPKVMLPLEAFSSEHGAPAERFYNLVCTAYGYDSKLFASVVENGYLSEERARVCKYEYLDLSRAVRSLIDPHIDKEKADKALASTWFR